LKEIQETVDSKDGIELLRINGGGTMNPLLERRVVPCQKYGGIGKVHFEVENIPGTGTHYTSYVTCSECNGKKEVLEPIEDTLKRLQEIAIWLAERISRNNCTDLFSNTKYGEGEFGKWSQDCDLCPVMRVPGSVSVKKAMEQCVPYRIQAAYDAVEKKVEGKP
jgi:hypothetical protein